MSEKRTSFTAKSKSSLLPRFQKAPPMSGEGQTAFHEEARIRWGVEAAAARAASRGLTLMVKSLESPYCVPYPEFVEEVLRRQEGDEGRTVEITSAGQHAGEMAVPNAAELQPVEAVAP